MIRAKKAQYFNFHIMAENLYNTGILISLFKTCDFFKVHSLVTHIG